MSRRFLSSILAAGLACAALPALAQGQDGLRIGVGAAVTSLDPHYHQLGPNNAVAQMIFDRLVRTGPEARLQPGMAESWQPVSDTVWEFKLRRDIRFQDGTPFTADDVAFTVERVPTVPNSPSSFAIYTKPITRVEVVDPYTLRLHTAGPYPLLPTDLARLAIISRKIGSGASTADYNSGKAAIGTGPYRVVEHRMGERIRFERNSAWAGPQPDFAQIDYRVMLNDASRTTALLAGDVDAIDQVPTSDIRRLQANAGVTLSEITSLRLIFLSLDDSRTEATPFVTDNDGKPISPNPLKDIRVRRALSMAIDRGSIVERVMESAATPSGQFLSEGAFGYVPGLNPPAYDMAAARQLLAEAGFPNGFRITLHGTNDRYTNDARILQAIGQMWTRVGVRTAVEALPYATYVGRANQQDYSAFLFGWGVASGEASNPLRNLVSTYNRNLGYGASNRGRYSNPELDRLIGVAMTELDEGKREAMMQQATRMAFDDVAIIPLHIQKNIWALRRGLAHEARADELTRAQDFRLAR